MSVWTTITDIAHECHINQSCAKSPAEALANGLERLPDHLLSDEDVDVVLSLVSAPEKLQLIQVSQAKGVWLWTSHAQMASKILAYVVKTDVT